MNERKAGGCSRFGIEQLEPRLCMAVSMGWEGPGRGTAELTYYLPGSAPGLSAAETRSAIATALEAWSSVAAISFSPTNTPGLPNSLDIDFAPIDGPGGTLAQAYYPVDVVPSALAGDITFDASETWEIGNRLGSAAYDLVYVAVHEIGHALGLPHTNAIGAVMQPSVSPNQTFQGLSWYDENAILGLYASASMTPADPVDGGDGGSQGNGTGGLPPWLNWLLIFFQNIPSTTRAPERLDAAPLFNAADPNDVNGDGFVSPFDALLVINHLSSLGANQTALGKGESLAKVDTNGDYHVTPADVLAVVNSLNDGRAATLSRPEEAAAATSGAVIENGTAVIARQSRPEEIAAEFPAVPAAFPSLVEQVFAGLGQEAAAPHAESELLLLLLEQLIAVDVTGSLPPNLEELLDA